MWVAIAGTAGCVVAASDYALIGWFVNHRLIRQNSTIRAASGRATILRAGALSALTVSRWFRLPFYPQIWRLPVTILARFVTAVVLPSFRGSTARAGGRVKAPGGALVSRVALALIGGWGIWRTVRGIGRRKRRRLPLPSVNAHGTRDRSLRLQAFPRALLSVSQDLRV